MSNNLTEKFNFRTGQQKYNFASSTPFSVKPNEAHESPLTSAAFRMPNSEIPTRTDADGYQLNAKARDWSGKDVTPEVKSKDLGQITDNNNRVDKLLSLNDKKFNMANDVLRRKR